MVSKNCALTFFTAAASMCLFFLSTPSWAQSSGGGGGGGNSGSVEYNVQGGGKCKFKKSGSGDKDYTVEGGGKDCKLKGSGAIEKDCPTCPNSGAKWVGTDGQSATLTPGGSGGATQ